MLFASRFSFVHLALLPNTDLVFDRPASRLCVNLIMGTNQSKPSESVIENNNGNLSTVSGIASITNYNPNVNFRAGLGASLHYAPVTQFNTPASEELVCVYLVQT